MKKVLSLVLLSMMILPGITLGQLSVSGEVTPSAMFRVSNANLINLPFRLGTLKLDYSIGDFDIKTVTAIETRWQDAEFDAEMIQFREAYLTWYPNFGEVKLGKMIHAWGAADGNNPTDNLSAYDFYYMFLSGTDRKIGNLGLSAKSYLGDWQGEVVFTPEHKGNRLPFNEPDFPIQFPFEPDAYDDVESPSEYGLRIQRAFNAADISLSYLKTHDQLFSLLTLHTPDPSSSNMLATPHFGFRNTNVFGLDFVAFPGNWTLRGEGAFFQTKTPELESPEVMVTFPVEAEYLQYVLQVEYQFANEVSLMAQYLGTNVTKAEGFTSPESGIGYTFLTTDNFRPGLGTPFAMISDEVVILSSLATFFDGSLELREMVMVNLAETGYMINIGSAYSLMDGLSLDTSLSYFIGGNEDGNRFREMEDFSNLTVGLTYNF